MVKETHTKGSYIFALIALPFFSNKFLNDYNIVYKSILMIVYFYFSYVGSLYPDIDLKNSYISKTHPKLYKIFGTKFRHRSFTHSLIALYFLSYLFDILVKYTNYNISFICAYSGFLLGYLSHLCLDFITKEGIELFYPITINFSILPIKTSSKTEKIIYKFLNFIFVFLIGYQFYILF